MIKALSKDFDVQPALPQYFLFPLICRSVLDLKAFRMLLMFFQQKYCTDRAPVIIEMTTAYVNGRKKRHTGLVWSGYNQPHLFSKMFLIGFRKALLRRKTRQIGKLHICEEEHVIELQLSILSHSVLTCLGV